MSGPEVIGTGWACWDCVDLLANGETPDRFTEDQAAEWLAEIDRRAEGLELELGGGGPHDEDCGEWHGSTDCYCEQVDFSWSPCDVCGSHLGGSRDAVTFFRAREVAL